MKKTNLFLLDEDQEEKEYLVSNKENELLSNILTLSKSSNSKAIQICSKLYEGRETLQNCLEKNEDIKKEVGRSNYTLIKIQSILVAEKMTLWMIIFLLSMLNLFLIYRKF
jgi:hypothetical protein